MSSSLTLESVQAEFQQWRQQKRTRGSRVPDELRRKALALRGQVKTSQLVSALGLSGSTLKQWSGEKNNETPPANPPAEFVALPIDLPTTAIPAIASQKTPSTQQLQLSCESGNGLRWCLQGDIHHEQLSAFIHAVTRTQGTLS